MDAIVIDREHVVTVDCYGDLYEWDINNPEMELGKILGLDIQVDEYYTERGFYLAWHTGRLLFVCVYGTKVTNRFVFNHQCNFMVHNILLLVFDP